MSKKLNSTVNKKEIVERLYKRLDKQIQKELISDCVTYVFAWITEQLMLNKDVCIKNFATFSTKKNTRKSQLSEKIYSFYFPKIYVQPILRKIIKYTLKTKKESNNVSK